VAALANPINMQYSTAMQERVAASFCMLFPPKAQTPIHAQVTTTAQKIKAVWRAALYQQVRTEGANA
jgi:hypothetical protein